jgi:ZIP family zinc transporter
MPLWLQAGGWGLFAGAALVLGAAVGWFVRVPQRAVAAVMAFGSGVLISALSFELMDEAYQGGGFAATAVGFLGGSVVYTIVNKLLAMRVAKHR